VVTFCNNSINPKPVTQARDSIIKILRENGIEDDLGGDGMKRSSDVGTGLRPILVTTEEE
jgi:hypothetical protein